MRRRSFCAAAAGAAASAALPLPLRLAAAAGGPVRPAGDLPAVSLDGGQIVLPAGDVTELSRALRGAVLLPGHDGYDRSRQVWNGMFDRRPALIARCAGAADVREAVGFARSHGLLLAVRAGGHSTSGQSVCEGGMMIDLTAMDGVRVDPGRKRVRVEGGVLLGAMDAETQAFGLATTAGTVSHTGAAGLTLGGGMGRMARRHGLACDNLESVDVVTADGSYLKASRRENRDLFWGLRGGGGNFGVATAFEYRLHEIGPTVLGGSLFYPLNKAKQMLAFAVEFAATAPRELSLSGICVMPPTGRGMAMMGISWIGDLAEGERVVERLRAFGKPMMEQVKAQPYVKLQQSGDAGLPNGLNYYLKSGFFPAMPQPAIDALVDGLEPSPHRNAVALINHLGGAIADLSPRATAYAHRKAEFDVIVGASWTNREHSQDNVAWGRGYWDSVADWSSGFYVNNMMDEPDRRVRANYLGNYDRLLKLKNRYDPGNLFRRNANIRPGAA